MSDFVKIYKSHGLTLHNCPICRLSSGMQHHWDGNSLFLYCANGCGSVEVKCEGNMTAEDMIVKAVNRWNAGDWEQ